MRPSTHDTSSKPETFEAAWRSRFEEFATVSDDDAGIAGWSPSGLDARLRRFGELWVGGRGGECWLDVGCGAGTYTRLLLKHGLEVVGVDYSFVTLQKARTRSEPFERFVMANVLSLPFRPLTFSGVICFGVLQALSSSEPALKELSTQVCPGGEIWIDGLNRHCVVHAWDTIRRRVSGRSAHLRYDSPGRIRKVLLKAGFVDIRLDWLPLAPRRWPRIQRGLETPLARALLRRVPLLAFLFSHAFIVSGKRPPA